MQYYNSCCASINIFHVYCFTEDNDGGTRRSRAYNTWYHVVFGLLPAIAAFVFGLLPGIMLFLVLMVVRGRVCRLQARRARVAWGCVYCM